MGHNDCNPRRFFGRGANSGNLHAPAPDILFGDTITTGFQWITVAKTSITLSESFNIENKNSGGAGGTGGSIAGNGNPGAAGTSAFNGRTSTQGNGGAGGNGQTTTGGAGGNGGSVLAETHEFYQIAQLLQNGHFDVVTTLYRTARYLGHLWGAGGGGGGGGGSSLIAANGGAGGNGGAGAGIMIWMAPTITISSGADITAKGRNGQNGAAGGTNGGGGGGGGGGSGGLVILVSEEFTNNGSIFVTAGSGGSGGAGGAGGQPGVAGQNGLAGLALHINMETGLITVI